MLARYGPFVIVLACECGPSSSADSAIDGCNTDDFVDDRAVSAQIDWTFAVSPRCVEIRAGQTVTWNGSFSVHPLQADQGDTPNPIATADTSGASSTVTFSAAGTFGFKCQVHSSMIGAVHVVP